jgi:hypothetical protein
VIELSDAQARRMRMRGQHLLDGRATTVHDVVRHTGGLQSQDARAWFLSVRARLPGVALSDVQRARVEERSIVRNWYMRGTLHTVASEDAAWLLSLIGAHVVRGSASRRRQLGIDDDTYARALRILRDALASGPQPRAEIALRLRDNAIPPDGQRTLHILHRAAMEGVICQGPSIRGGSDAAFVLTADWLGDWWRSRLPSYEARLAELARRYLAAHSPAEPRDLATWSGLPVPEAREAFRLIAAELVEVRVRDEAAWILAAQRESALAPADGMLTVQLLPIFDGYLLGHRRRDLLVADQHAHHILPGGGWLNPTVVVDGLAVALWSAAQRRNAMTVTVEPYAAWNKRWSRRVDAEVADLARFRGAEASWRLGESIARRPAI